MSGRVSVCSICPKENEQIDAVIRINKERRSVIYGTILDENGDPVADAVVKLLQVYRSIWTIFVRTFMSKSKIYVEDL